MASNDFIAAVKLFNSIAKPYLRGHGSSSYGSFVKAIQNELDKVNGQPQILEDWILPRIKEKYTNSVFDLIETVVDEFDRSFPNPNQMFCGKRSKKGYSKNDCCSALKAFAKFILGQYKADLYVALENGNDFDNCKKVARHALFCRVTVAEEIKNGKLGSKLNKKKHISGNKGNMYYSWFCYQYQRKTPNQNKGKIIKFMPGQPNPEGLSTYTIDDNSYANQAIKKAVIAGFPIWMKVTSGQFKSYMACHIWDKTCYDYRYHTSVFNLVLLPASVGGLSDYCPAVKELLRYEAAMRFGVYPNGKPYKLTTKVQRIYDRLHKEWRQLDEHQIAISRPKSFIPKGI